MWSAGEVMAESEAASASLAAAGPRQAEKALQELLARLPLGRWVPLDAVCVGSAGLSLPGAAEFLRDRLSPLARAEKVIIVSDGLLALAAAGVDEGVAVICGTGSVAVGSYRDRTTQGGGWGYLLGDEGGGYWVVREAIRVLLRRRESRQPLGDLGARLLADAGAADLAELHRRYYAQPHLPRGWAAHARVVLSAADPAVAGILAAAGEAVASLAAGVIGELGAPVALPVVLAGGLSDSASFVAAVRRAVARTLPGAELRVLADAPVAGAVRLARRAAEP